MPFATHGILTPRALEVLGDKLRGTDATTRSFAVVGIPGDALLALVEDLVETRRHLVRTLVTRPGDDRPAIGAKQHLKDVCTRDQFDALFEDIEQRRPLLVPGDSEGGIPE